jgi:hypothetical protein
MADDKTTSDANSQTDTTGSKGSDGNAPNAGAGNGDPSTPDSGEDSVEEEMEIARKHADPSRGDKVVEGGDRVSTDEGGNPQE